MMIFLKAIIVVLAILIVLIIAILMFLINFSLWLFRNILPSDKNTIAYDVNKIS